VIGTSSTLMVWLLLYVAPTAFHACITTWCYPGFLSSHACTPVPLT
jgi:hypothetical protein